MKLDRRDGESGPVGYHATASIRVGARPAAGRPATPAGGGRATRKPGPDAGPVRTRARGGRLDADQLAPAGAPEPVSGRFGWLRPHIACVASPSAPWHCGREDQLSRDRVDKSGNRGAASSFRGAGARDSLCGLLPSTPHFLPRPTSPKLIGRFHDRRTMNNWMRDATRACAWFGSMQPGSETFCGPFGSTVRKGVEMARWQ